MIKQNSFFDFIFYLFLTIVLILFIIITDNY